MVLKSLGLIFPFSLPAPSLIKGLVSSDVERLNFYAYFYCKAKKYCRQESQIDKPKVV